MWYDLAPEPKGLVGSAGWRQGFAIIFVFSAENKAQFPVEGHSGLMVLLGRESERPGCSWPGPLTASGFGERASVTMTVAITIIIVIRRIAIVIQWGLLIIYTFLPLASK